MEKFNYFYYLFCFGVFGLLIGSFLNVCIYRIPLNQTVITTPSHCMNCNHKLAWYDLFPLFSYLFLGGKCRYCKAKISIQYPIIEALNSILWISTYYFMGGLNILTIIYCIFFSTLLVLSAIDINEGIVPNKINIFIFILGLIILFLDYHNWILHIIGFFAISVPLLIPLFISGMGGGDVKLFAVAGFFIGWKLILVALVFASFTGSIFGIVTMIKNGFDGKAKIRFVPFIMVGVILSVYFGDDLINWYISSFFASF